MSRFVTPATDTLTLANGDTLVVRRRLNAGEHRAMMMRLSLATEDGHRTVDPLQVGLSTLTAYLLDWSLTNEAGEREKIQGLTIEDLESVLNNLDPADFKELVAAVEAHEARGAAARAQLKKSPAGVPALSAISPSPSAAAGASSGSASSTPTTTQS